MTRKKLLEFRCFCCRSASLGAWSALSNLKQILKIAVLTIVLQGFSVAHAGAYEDFFDAIRTDNARVVRQLLARGFDPNTLDPQRRSPLLLAVSEPSPKVAELLIDALGIDLDAANEAGENALMMAALRGHEALVRRLLARGAEVNKPGWAPLHYAATGGHAGIVRMLLERHAYVDAESPNGTTPLMMAAQYGSTEAVKLLLEEGAQAAQTNKIGLNALDFARLGSRPDAIRMLTAALRPTPAPGAAPVPAAPTSRFTWPWQSPRAEPKAP